MINQIDAFHSLDTFGVLYALYDYIVYGGNSQYFTGVTMIDKIDYFFSLLPYYLVVFFTRWIVFSAIVTVLLAIYFTFAFINYKKARMDTFDAISGKEDQNPKGALEIQENPKWKQVMSHIDSMNQSDWKLAILEADIMLADLLDKLSLPGESIGEKLKAVEPSDFTSIEEAWEAHKVRNAIAHEGSEFIIDQREAKRVIGLFKKVFEEFELI